MSGMKRDVSHAEEITMTGDKADDATSTNSQPRDRDVKESMTKVQHFLDTQHRS